MGISMVIRLFVNLPSITVINKIHKTSHKMSLILQRISKKIDHLQSISNIHTLGKEMRVIACIANLKLRLKVRCLLQRTKC
jgi:hypothetical protein